MNQNRENTMFTNKLKYFLILFSFLEYVLMLMFVKIPLEGWVAIIMLWLIMFVWNLVDVFDIKNSSSVLHVHVESGDNSFRRSMLYLLCFLFLIFLPTVMMIA